ncbi:MAG: IclR family transcriptional regulator [Candidatus Nanopelagicales bacterium]
MSNASRGWGPAPASTAAVQSVDRAITVLEILARRGEAGVTDIAAELGVHKSTAFRLVSVLDSRGLVEQHSQRGKYRLGLGLVRLAGATTARLDLIQQGRPVCEALAASTGETINIAILSGHDALYLDQVAGTSVLQLHNWVGQRIPLHCTSNGKALIAFLPEHRQRELLVEPLARFTAKTIIDVGVLLAELADVRKNGYATAFEELEEGLVAVSSPILDMNGNVVASLSASGPVFRLPDERAHELGVTVRESAAAISHRLGSAPR